MPADKRPCAVASQNKTYSTTEAECYRSLCSKVISDSGSRPIQALKMLVQAERCFASEITTGVPGGVKGAFGM